MGIRLSRGAVENVLFRRGQSDSQRSVKSSPTVCSSSESFVPSDHAPCWLGYFPVIIEARVGVQVGFGQ